MFITGFGTAWKEFVNKLIMHGEDLGVWGDGPPENLRWGRPMHWSFQYLEKYCYWMWGKVRSDWKGFKEDCLDPKSRFWSRKVKGHIHVW